MLSFTFLLYLLIFVSSTLFAKLSQQKRLDGMRFKWKMLTFAFFIHWFFCAFTNIGVDYEQYKSIISNDCGMRFLMGQEVGFNGLSFLLYEYIHNADICIFIYKTSTLLIFYLGFYLLRNHAQLWLCVLAYNVHTYFAGFYIIAMQIAVSLVFLSAVLALVYHNKLLPILLSVIATTFHTSAIVMVVCFVIVVVLNFREKSIGIGSFVVLAILLLVILIKAKDLFAYSLSNYEVLSAYERYEDIQKERGSGLFNYFLNAFFLIFVIPLFKSKINPYAVNSIMVFYGFTFLFSILGYVFGSSRLNYYNVIFLDVSIPFIFFQRINMNVKIKSLMAVRTERKLWTIYLLYLGITILNKAVSPTSTSKLYDYAFFNPFQ